MKPGKGGQFARSAGTYVQLVGRDAGYALLRLSSGEVRMVRAECRATIGAVSNPDQQNIVDRQGRPQSLARRRRPVRGGRSTRSTIRMAAARAHLGRPPSGDAMGQADQGQEDAAQQGDRPPDRAAPAPALMIGTVPMKQPKYPDLALVPAST